MDWLRHAPEWFKTIFLFFFAKELTTGEWVRAILTQAFSYAQQTISGAFLDVWKFALASTSLIICAAVLASTTIILIGATWLIRGRHRTHESITQTQATTTGATHAATTNNISVQSSMQYGAGPCMPNYSPDGASIELFEAGSDLSVWWAKQKMELKDIPSTRWVRQTIKKIDNGLLVKLGGDITRYDTSTNGFEELRNDLEVICKREPHHTSTRVNLSLYELTNRIQKKNETLECFGKSLRDIASKVGQVSEKELQNVFIRGLRNQELKKEVSRHTFQSQLASLEDQVEYATKTEAAWANASEVTDTPASDDETGKWEIDQQIARTNFPDHPRGSLKSPRRPDQPGHTRRSQQLQIQEKPNQNTGQLQQPVTYNQQLHSNSSQYPTQQQKWNSTPLQSSQHGQPQQFHTNQQNSLNRNQVTFEPKEYEPLPQRDKRQCFTCREWGHVAKNCPQQAATNQ